MTMLRARILFGLVPPIIFGGSSLVLAAEQPIRLWNLTSATMTELRLAPAGSQNFGPDQCKNDKDGSADRDERRPITGVTPGRHDIKIGYQDGKTCRVQNVPIERGKAFSIEDKDLTDCSIPFR